MLEDKLFQLAKSDTYPFHMPGHKRQINCSFNPYSIDITEIDGFDNLHHANDLLRDAQEQAAKLYGAQKSYYLVNGSTCGILASICAATQKRDKVLVARNCHKAVYHAILLNELSPVYLYPKITSQGIQGQMKQEDVQKILEESRDIAAVILTSPTYDGVVSDIRGIADAVHEYGIPLIVDEAHGAHFGFAEDLPKNATQLGADAVIVSVHKTLPAFTQTALLHLCSDRISQKRIEKYLGIFETSSPSYILMAGIEHCTKLMLEKRNELFPIYMERIQQFYSQVKHLKYLRVVRKQDFLKEEAFDFDETKILIFTDRTLMTGKKLHDILLYQYDIQIEMVAGDYVLALSSVMDTQEGFDRLADALIKIDRMIASDTIYQRNKKIDDSCKKFASSIYRKLDKVHEIYEMEYMEERIVLLETGIDQVSANFIYLYPPGIPIVVPGEKITKELVENLQTAIAIGLDIEGLVEDKWINIVIL